MVGSPPIYTVDLTLLILALGNPFESHKRQSFMGIGFASQILLDLVLFADRTNAEPKSNRCILWEMEGLQQFELSSVCIFQAV